jgi:hypothetical protein
MVLVTVAKLAVLRPALKIEVRMLAMISRALRN